MELLSMLFGLVFWPTVIATWVLLTRRLRVRRRIGIAGTVFLVALPLLGALSIAHYMLIDEPLFMAARQGDAPRVRRLLRLGADPNAVFEGHPALVAAAETGSAEIVRLLLRHGANPHAHVRGQHLTALLAAEYGRHKEAARLLREAGATY